MTQFHPHPEREIPLAQWTYELTLSGLMQVENELFVHYIEILCTYPRWRWLKRRYYGRLATLALTRHAELLTELSKQEPGASRG